MIRSSSSQSVAPERIAVGMSGGLDSSVVAALCVDRGWDVIGLTLHMFKEGSRCCSIEDVERARAVCDYLGLRHYVVNAEDQFQEAIIEPFVDAYASGRTPSPCVWCNERIKFGTLHRRAVQLGCGHIASGHYARVVQKDGAWRLLRPQDRSKDQTYFLHRLSQEQLGRCLFPLETWTKPEAMAYARERGLPVKTTPDAESQDLCFVPDDGHAAFVEAQRPELKRSGAIVNGLGAEVGRHGGFHRFTVGQRKGLGVAAAHRLYVRDVDPEANRVTVGPKEEVMDDICWVENAHWISGVAPAMPLACTARIRYRHQATPVRVMDAGDGSLKVTFGEPQFAVTPGQAAVFYEGDEILGGGWIAVKKETIAV